MNDKELALKIIELTGSKENISSVRHCATRLRLVVKNKDKINVKAIESLDKVKRIILQFRTVSDYSRDRFSKSCL